MPKQLKYVAQDVMDMFYRDYKGNSDFFDIDDFIEFTGNNISGIYQSFYQEKYNENVKDKKEEVVTFDSGVLSEQVIEVKDNGTGTLEGKLLFPVMSFTYDQQSVGFQDVFVIEPKESNYELERTNISSIWSLRYMPVTNRAFFYSDINTIKIIKKGNSNINKVRVLYIPTMFPEAVIPDGIIEVAIEKTVQSMRTMIAGKIVKESLDGNKNEIAQTEIDQNTLNRLPTARQ
jgi:hypothetical protein